MQRQQQILIVDDDAEIRNLLRDYLQQNGYRALAVADGRYMRHSLEENQIDLIVLDLMLPGEDGLSLCRNLRARSDIPVIMLTARGEETDRIIGLEMGADDYLPKPFNPRELLARIKGVLRRANSLPVTEISDEVKRIHFVGWTLDVFGRQLISPDGVFIPLSGSEYRLLRVFLNYPNQVLSRDRLLDMTRGKEASPFDRSIDVQVGRLRRRLGDTEKEAMLIRTVRGEGYVLAAEVESETS